MNPPAVAVTGARGFIGTRLVAELRARGHPVAAYHRDRPLVWPDPEAPRPQVVFHLASSITPAVAEAHPERAAADCQTFAALLGRLAREPRPPAVVLTSSGGAVYRPGLRRPCREADPTRPSCRYAQAKLDMENLLRSHAGVIDGAILRLSNVYGPGQRVGKGLGVLAHWLRAAAAGEPLRLIGDPATTRDFVHVDDVVACLRRLAARSWPRGEPPLILNVASGVSTSLDELLAIVAGVVGRPLPVIREPARSVDRPESALDVERAARLLGWRARTPLADGVTSMWREFEAASIRAPSSPSTLLVTTP